MVANAFRHNWIHSGTRNLAPAGGKLHVCVLQMKLELEPHMPVVRASNSRTNEDE
jgi:hypothetical protein